MDVMAEIDNLKRRVGDLEGAFNVLSGRFGMMQPELNDLKRQNNDGFERVDGALRQLASRLETINTHVWGLRDDLPNLIDKSSDS
mgnify:CR=1 FL=1